MTHDTLQWDLEVDAAWLAPIPEVEDNASRARWIAEQVERIAGGRDLDRADIEVVESIASAMLDLRRDGGAQLWLSPVGMVSDVLVTIDLARTGAPGVGTTQELLDGVGSSTSVDVVELRTDAHGVGMMVRRAEVLPSDRSTLVAQWTARLNDGTKTIVIDAIGTTLAAFAVYDDAFVQLVEGIRIQHPASAIG